MEEIDKGKLKGKLIDKLELEYNDYVNELKKSSNIIIIENAYQLVTKKEIIYCIKENKDLSVYEMNLLLHNNNVLDTIYDNWNRLDCNYSELLQFSVDNTISEYKKREHNKNRDAR